MLPKKLWIYWDKGWDDAPELVKKCGESWAYHNPEWEINFLDAENIKKFFDIYDWMPTNLDYKPRLLQKFIENTHKLFHSTELIKKKKFSIQGQSDILRINLLSKYGGVWVDATLWCHKPLESWLIPLEKGFFAFCNKENPSMISSWFLAGSNNNEIIQKFSNEVRKYWAEHNKAEEYYWFHQSFKKLYETDKSFQLLWNSIKKIDNGVGSIGPHYFAPYKKEKLKIFDEKFKKMIDSREIPVFKLSHREKYSLNKFKSIQYLLGKLNN
jgi:hypothetical protein